MLLNAMFPIDTDIDLSSSKLPAVVWILLCRTVLLVYTKMARETVFLPKTLAKVVIFVFSALETRSAESNTGENHLVQSSQTRAHQRHPVRS